MLNVLLGVALGTSTHDVLFVLVDDLGTESVGVYDEGPAWAQPPTPTIDALAREGLRFERAYSQPICSATRATIFTGLHPFRTGVGDLIRSESRYRLPRRATTLAEVLAPAGVHCALIGKWHLGFGPPSDLVHPVDRGWHEFSGTEGNLVRYDDYDWHEMGTGRTRSRRHRYATSEVVDEAIERIERMPSPWFLTVAFHAPHRPLHTPPLHLHSYGIDPASRYLAMIEALDTELGRLLSHVDRERTHVIFCGDNGIASEYATFVENEVPRAKGTTWEMGGRVPLVVSGPAVARPGTTSEALVQSCDLFATILDLFGVAGRTPDSLSFHGAITSMQPPARDTIYLERFSNIDAPGTTADRQAARGRRYKLLWNHATDEFEFHDLEGYRQERNRRGHPRTRLCRGRMSSAAHYDDCLASLSEPEGAEFARLWTYLATIRYLNRR